MVVSISDFDEDSKNEMITYFSQCAKVDGIIIYGANTKTECSVPAVTIGSCDEIDSIVLSVRMSNAVEMVEGYKRGLIGKLSLTLNECSKIHQNIT